MKVIISNQSNVKVYHRVGCPHITRINYRNRRDITVGKAKELGYRRCKCCGNLKGSIRALSTSLDVLGNMHSMEIVYQPAEDSVYMRTETSFWKGYWSQKAGYLLFHVNYYDAAKTFEELTHSSFHRQNDFKPTESLEKILNYIEEHDKAKTVIEEDYRKLPQKTKKQKKYYRIAERNERSRKIKRVFNLFERIERERAAAANRSQSTIS